jgi:molybdopterin-containing oxidoreductase family iron-sulfur binding subunit
MSNEAKERPSSEALLGQFRPDREQWESLEELAQREDFDRFLQEEFPREAAVLRQSGMDRRSFLKLMGAALAIAGINGCTAQPPNEPIVPYVRTPEEIIPGIPVYFASTAVLGGYGTGILIETHEGRPTRIEGNVNHPASLGSSDLFLQASILELYNPERSVYFKENQQIRTVDEFEAAMAGLVEQLKSTNGQGLRILTETVTSPTLNSQLRAILQKYPNARWHQYEPINQDAVVAGSQLAFGAALNPVYHFDAADVVVSLDANFLSTFPGSVRYAREFGERRKVRYEGNGHQASMNRLYVVEPSPTITGAVADHKLPMRAGDVQAFAAALANALGVDAGSAPSASWDETFFSSMLEDLQANAGSSLIVAGPQQPAVVHALAHAMNVALGNVGTTVTYTPSVMANPVIQVDDLADLVADMQAGNVQQLVILGGNPAYTAPADLNFAEALANVPFSLALSLYMDETSELCTWHVPATHFVEEWSDTRAYDGTASLIQPPIGPLYTNVRSAHNVLAMLAEDERSGYELVRDFWQSQMGGNFERQWRYSLHDGVVADSAYNALTPTLRNNLAQQLSGAYVQSSDGLEIVFTPDESVWDGRFAGNSWLQEIPKALTKLVWDNAAMMSPATAASLGVSDGDLLDLNYQGRTLQAAAWIIGGHANNSISLSQGYGRTSGSSLGVGHGFNANLLRSSATPNFGGGLTAVTAGGSYQLVSTGGHYPLQGEHPAVVAGTLDRFNADPEHFLHEEEYKSILRDIEWSGYQWGMSIDMNACIGCNSCVIACQTENNIPNVGKDQVAVNREMHWLRIDLYESGQPGEGNTHFQPVPCMHCENAPCELVCPVAATVHSNDGLNQMVYNRCIGTRYCANNCPYSVRRFNFVNLYEDDDPLMQEWRNPDVSVRVRGVMEKCTYCVQRISQAQITSKRDNTPIPDGAIMPACASACPTRAISFGDINNPETEVAKLKDQPHDYGLLAEYNTRPRTTYLARVLNLHSALGNSAIHHEG